MLQGGRLLPPGPQMGFQGGRSEILGGPRALPRPRAEKNGALGGVFGRPEVTLEGLGPILKMLKNHWFLLCLEPLGPPRGPKGGQKVVKKAPSDASKN